MSEKKQDLKNNWGDLADTRLNSRDVAQLLASETGLSNQTCYKVLRALVRVVNIQLMLHHEIALPGLGKFYTQVMPGRHLGYDVKRRKRISKHVPSYRQVKFQVSPTLRQKVR